MGCNDPPDPIPPGRSIQRTEFQIAQQPNCQKGIFPQNCSTYIYATHVSIWKKMKDYVDQLHELEIMLDNAISKENYENAAELRDKITSIKKEYSSSAKTV